MLMKERAHMKTPSKRLFFILGLCVVCAICPLIWRSVNSYTRVLKTNWGIELPRAGAKTVFSYSEPSFHGDGIRYHVMDYPIGNESQKMQNAAFQLDKLFGGIQPTEAQIDNVEQLLKQIDANDMVIPDWERCRLIDLKQEDGSELFMFYQSETGTVFIVESFI